ncbi:MAG: ABC transporter permease, partial [bacterium]|nr:ABC transporter permease [bacterium]
MRSSNKTVILAVFKREFSSYFRNPTGYVFITLFVFLSAVAAFWQEGFFLNNLANLDQLNRYFPYLMIFLAPAITMGLWAEERKQGTEELLLTLPASDAALLIGKYLAAFGIYTVALAFSLSHVVVLLALGSPDPGIVLATYFGYWLMGAALLAVGLLASQLTDNLTVAFIVGSVLCAVPVFLRHSGAVLAGGAQRTAENLSVVEQFRDLSAGVVTLGSVVYFVSLAVAVLYLNVKLAGKQRWPARADSPKIGRHLLARALALLGVVGALSVLAGELGGRLDVTSEQIHSLSDPTMDLMEGLDPNRPVFIQAYLSPEVPRGYLEVRRNLASFLREFSARSGGKIASRIIETAKYTEQAREARERYGIEPYRIPPTEESASGANEIFLGVVFTCGTEESVIKFFDRGLPVEYELMRSIRVVSRVDRRKVGILDTKAQLFGGFDFQTKRQSRDWSIIPELRKQYEVTRVSPAQDLPDDLDVLIAVLPNTLDEEALDRLVKYIHQGKPVLVMLDPLPSFNLELSPAAADAPQQPMFGGPPPPRQPSVDLTPLLEALGITWEKDQIVWDANNPHPQLRQLPEEVIFVGQGSQAEMPFQESETMTAGLQELVLLYGGAVGDGEDGKTTFTPLMTTGEGSGVFRWNQLVRRSLFGVGLTQGLPHKPDDKIYTLAARVAREGDQPLNAVVVADADMMGEQFFELRRRGIENLRFDNVTFLLNAVDELAGDGSFIELRKRRPKHRTLEAVEARTRVYEQQRVEQTEEAQATAEGRLEEAQARLDATVAELQARR